LAALICSADGTVGREAAAGVAHLLLDVVEDGAEQGRPVGEVGVEGAHRTAGLGGDRGEFRAVVAVAGEDVLCCGEDLGAATCRAVGSGLSLIRHAWIVYASAQQVESRFKSRVRGQGPWLFFIW
jgi:hypothetical protein